MSIFSKRAVGRALTISAALALAVSTAVQPSVAAPVSSHHLAAVPAPNTSITTQSVGIQMFMWPWVSLQSECTNVLGPSHVDWIMVSPPQEDVYGSQWWVHYQPVSYQLNSQLGTEQQFQDMVSACNTAGVQVIVDAVINHMANSSGKGFGGSSFTKYDYPGIYSSTDFHAGLASSDPNYCASQISNWNDVQEITHCELLGLPDLATEKPNVRQTIADYLNKLTAMGVAGFRVDAAKHIGLTDLTAIHNMLNPVNGKLPYFVQESIGSAGYNRTWTPNGDVFAWDYQKLFYTMFGGLMGYGMQNQAVNDIVGDPNSTIIMISNHDNEHGGNGGTLTYQDYKAYQAASEYLLADSRGKPMLYTGYAFSNYDLAKGPAQNVDGLENAAVCPAGAKAKVQQQKYTVGSFICMERWTGIQGMVQWHHEVGTAPQTNSALSGKLLSFTRGTGFFAVNGNQISVKKAVTKTVKTGLPKGIYCDVVSGGPAAKSGSKCLGTKVTVDSKGKATITLGSMVALALDATNKLK